LVLFLVVNDVRVELVDLWVASFTSLQSHGDHFNQVPIDGVVADLVEVVRAVQGDRFSSWVRACTLAGNPADSLGGFFRLLATTAGLGFEGRRTDFVSDTSTSRPIGFHLGYKSARTCGRESLRSRWDSLAKQARPSTASPRAFGSCVAVSRAPAGMNPAESNKARGHSRLAGGHS
jgi:hypothetical protein